MVGYVLYVHIALVLIVGAGSASGSRSGPSTTSGLLPGLNLLLKVVTSGVGVAHGLVTTYALYNIKDPTVLIVLGVHVAAIVGLLVCVVLLFCLGNLITRLT
jgi:integral membrane sensor domain MASE1